MDGAQSDYQIMVDCLEIKIPFHKEKGYIDDSFQKLITPQGFTSSPSFLAIRLSSFILLAPSHTLSDIEKLCCRACGTTIIQKDELGSRNQINKVLSLPSTYHYAFTYSIFSALVSLIALRIYWVELSDMWVCGCCNSKFLQFPREEIRAREGVCFVGDTYFLLHRSNLCEDSIELSGMSANDAYGKVPISFLPSFPLHLYCSSLVKHVKVSGCKTNTEWMPVSCTGCHEGLGLIENTIDAVEDSHEGCEREGERGRERENPKIYNYKLFKHRLSTAIGANEDYNTLK